MEESPINHQKQGSRKYKAEMWKLFIGYNNEDE